MPPCRQRHKAWELSKGIRPWLTQNTFSADPVEILLFSLLICQKKNEHELHYCKRTEGVFCVCKKSKDVPLVLIPPKIWKITWSHIYVFCSDVLAWGFCFSCVKYSERLIWMITDKLSPTKSLTFVVKRQMSEKQQTWMSKEQTFSKIIEKQYRDRQILRIHHIFTFCPKSYQEENIKIELGLSY